MIFDYSLAALRDRGAAVLPDLRAAAARAVLRGSTTMTFIGWIQIVLYCAIIIAIVPLLGFVHDARLQWRTHVPFPGAAAG